MPDKLPRSFYQRDDVVQISRDLLGKVLCTRINGQFTAAKIVETEAYNGRCDKACHAHLNKKTDRTSIMFGEPGYAYVYLCYGIHHLFNIVTNRDGLADAVLVRGIEPVEGTEIMTDRRGHKKAGPGLGNGPGILSQSLGITKELYGEDLRGRTVWIEDRGIEVPQDQITETTRIGVDYAEEDALLPWRFYITGNKYISRK